MIEEPFGNWEIDKFSWKSHPEIWYFLYRLEQKKWRQSVYLYYETFRDGYMVYVGEPLGWSRKMSQSHRIIQEEVKTEVMAEAEAYEFTKEYPTAEELDEYYLFK